MTVKMTMMRAMMVMLIDRLTGMAASAHAAVTLRDFGLVFAVVVLVVVEVVVGGASVQFWRIARDDEDHGVNSGDDGGETGGDDHDVDDADDVDDAHDEDDDDGDDDGVGDGEDDKALPTKLMAAGAEMRDLLDSEEVRESALEEVRRAGAERNASALAQAIKKCWALRSRRLGIAPQLLLQALAQLTEEMAKVAKIAGDHGISNLMLEDVEQIRRELHDKVQAVRGGVKVICRIRPFVEDDEVEPGTFPAVEQVDQDTLKVITEKLSNEPEGGAPEVDALDFTLAASGSVASNSRRSNSKSKVAQAANMFRFNGRVLGPRAGQEEIFGEVQGLVQSAIDGYNVLIAAAGTCGSGKSHTIFGPPFEKPGPGMPRERDWSGLTVRVANELFALQESRNSKCKERDDWRAMLEVDLQVVEVRNQRTVDLLGKASRPELNESRAGHLAFAGAMLLSNTGDNPFIEGACTRRVKDSRDFLRSLNSAFTATEGPYSAPKTPRTPASTASEAFESHVLVMLHLTRTNRATGGSVRSKIVLADLAPLSSPAAASSATSREVSSAYSALEAVIKASRREGQAMSVLSCVVFFFPRLAGEASSFRRDLPPMAVADPVAEVNPLLETKGLPRFQSIDVKHVEPAIEAILKSLREDFKSLQEELPNKKPEYEGLVELLEKLHHPLEYSWGVVSHLNGVKNSDALREVHQTMETEVVKAEMELAQSRVVFDALGSLETNSLAESRQRIVEGRQRKTSKRLKEEKYAYDEEALRPYFSLPKVLEGMFSIAWKLFGVDITQNDDAAERWHPDVMFFKVQDASTGGHIVSFFLDPYSRPEEKQGGAWMDGCLGRSKAVGTKPVAYLTCNGSPPVGSQPSLMTFPEAETLFHEFGHGLQHMLTHVEDGGCAGIKNVEWDAVELPSQFMENWLYHKATVESFAVHYETGEALPSDIFEKIKGSRIFMAASMMLRQLQLGDLDMKLHCEYDPDGSETFLDVQRRVAARYQILPPLDVDRFLCSFAHIFSGGYAAGYYSYKWAEVLSADAFAAFEEAGLDDDDALRSVGRRFRDTVLGCGGGRHPSKVYRHVRGKDATALPTVCGGWCKPCIGATGVNQRVSLENDDDHDDDGDDDDDNGDGDGGDTDDSNSDDVGEEEDEDGNDDDDGDDDAADDDGDDDGEDGRDDDDDQGRTMAMMMMMMMTAMMALLLVMLATLIVVPMITSATSASRRKHVLGQMLRDCLSGNARPVFLVTLSPHPEEKVHTSHSITFATALGGRSLK
eukprot:s1326_g9.t1